MALGQRILSKLKIKMEMFWAIEKNSENLLYNKINFV